MNEADPAEVTRRYVDSMFGPGAGERHLRFLDRIENAALREMMHRCHGMEADERLVSREESYLFGLVTLCALRSYDTAAMFAKTLRHLGTSRARVLEAVSRTAMWAGPIPATEAALRIQRALDEYDLRGAASLDAWFPQSP
jgi:hypothetical protein